MRDRTEEGSTSVQRARNFTLCTLAAAAFFATGCVAHHHYPSGPPVVVHEPGPPPHAPAHGYRHKHHRDGVDLVFDTSLGVYVVVGHIDHWFSDDHYYRVRDGRWFIASHFDGPWAVVQVDRLPTGLKVKHGGAKLKGKGKSKGHARH
jgi:hypothetical protein